MTRANIVRNIINDDGYYYTKHSVLEIVNVIFDEHEAQLKAKNERIREIEEAKRARKKFVKLCAQVVEEYGEELEEDNESK